MTVTESSAGSFWGPDSALAAAVIELNRCVLVGDRKSRGDPTSPSYIIRQATTSADLAAYYALRRRVFVEEQGLFVVDDRDAIDDDDRTVVLVALGTDPNDTSSYRSVLAGVRLGPVDGGPDIGWWRGSRLAVEASSRAGRRIGAALVSAACAYAESAGVLRFDATVQLQNRAFFERLGWQAIDSVQVAGREHLLMSWAINRIEQLAQNTKGELAELIGSLVDSGSGFRGDDAAPVPGSDLVASCDAIIPSMVERDPEWAGWCAGLVNVNDLLAMGAEPVALLDSVAGTHPATVAASVAGLQRFARAWGIPVIGGHTQIGVQPSLSVTAIGRTTAPVRGGGARPGDRIRVTADLGGQWRAGYHGQQWDSSSYRSGEELRSLAGVVPALSATAAKDVSMSGLIGTIGMLAEASGVAATVDVTDIVRPAEASVGDWLTCFPGFAMVSTERPAVTEPEPNLPGFLESAVCGELHVGQGVGLRWPDGVITEAIQSQVTGLGESA